MRYVFVGLLVVFTGDLTPAQESSTPAKPATIQKWIADLDSRNFKTRRKAEMLLLKTGKAAVPALLAVIKETGSLELGERAKKIIAEIRQQELDRITNAARQATAVVETPRRVFRAAAAPGAGPTSLATAFCIHPAGIFVTGHSGTRLTNGQTIPLVLHPGTPKQAKFNATVVRFDSRMKLAILQVQADREFPHVSLGSTKGMSELMKVFALGSQGQKFELDGKTHYPPVTTSSGFVCSLVMQAGKLYEICVDTGDEPGAIGGPLLNENGKVIGVSIGDNSLVSGRRLPISASPNTDSAIPVELLTELIQEPIVQFTAPKLNSKTVGQPCEFRARIIHLIPNKKYPDLDLVLVTNGIVRRHKMTRNDGLYRAKATPTPATQRPTTVQVDIKFNEGRITASVKDKTIRIGKRDVRLSEIRLLQIQPKSVAATLMDGLKIEGMLTPDETFAVVIGGVERTVKLASAVSLTVRPSIQLSQIMCQLVTAENGTDRILWQETFAVQQVQNK